MAHTFPGRLIRTLQTRGGVEAAARVLHDRQNVMLITGFSVAAGMPETDGPPGTALLGRILRQSGKQVTYVVDEANAPVLRATLEALGEPTDAIAIFRAGHGGSEASKQASALLDQVKPDAVMAIEMPARNVGGVRRNMRGVNNNDFNPPLDALLLQANGRNGVVTLGVGDGGNEAGMGVVRDLVPKARDNSDMASDVPAQHLITASVSNWGAEAVGVAYATLIGKPELIHTLDQQFAAIDASVRAGAVDGVSRKMVASVDGLSWEAHQGWFIQLQEAAGRTQMQPISLALMDSSDGGLYAARTFAENLTERTGRRVVRVLGLDHGNATYGGQYRKAGEAHAEALGLEPGDAAYAAAYVHGGRVRIGQLTSDVLTTLQTSMRGLHYTLSGEASNQVIAMACNTACTGLGYARGVNGAVVDLVRITANQMVETGGNHPVSLSTSGTEGVHAYREAVNHRIVEQIATRSEQLQSEGLSLQQIAAHPDILRLKAIKITEIGASANPVLGADGKQLVIDGRPQTSPALADIVNRLNADPPPSADEIQAAVNHYIKQIPLDATSVWLTCTHYPALIEQIRTALRANGRDIPVIDPMIHQVDATIQVLGREDVRVVPVESFANVSDAEIARIRHSIFRASNPADGTLHEFSRLNPETGKWETVEVQIRNAEAEAYRAFDAEGALQPEYENVLRAIAGYGPITPGDAAAPPTPPAGDGPLPQGVMVHVKEYGPLFLTTGILAATVPPEYLVAANGASWVVRGAGTLPIAIWPKTFAVNTKAGRALRALNALTFVGNGAYHNWTYVDGSGFPMNQLYAISDHGSLAQNAHEARTGKADGPPKWAKYTTLAAANAANGLLLPLYSIPVGFEAWGPNLLFGGGTAYLTYKALGGGQSHNPVLIRVASGAAAVGLMTFGVTYLMRLGEERAKGPQNGQTDTRQIQFDDTGLYDELFTRPI